MKIWMICPKSVTGSGINLSWSKSLNIVIIVKRTLLRGGWGNIKVIFHVILYNNIRSFFIIKKNSF